MCDEKDLLLHDCEGDHSKGESDTLTVNCMTRLGQLCNILKRHPYGIMYLIIIHSFLLVIIFKFAFSSSRAVLWCPKVPVRLTLSDTEMMAQNLTTVYTCTNTIQIGYQSFTNGKRSMVRKMRRVCIQECRMLRTRWHGTLWYNVGSLPLLGNLHWQWSNPIFSILIFRLPVETSQNRGVAQRFCTPYWRWLYSGFCCLPRYPLLEATSALSA